MSNPLRIYNSRINYSDLDRWIWIGLFTIASAILVFYLTITYRTIFHSDSAMKLMLGQEMARQFSLFPQGWHYTNDIPILWGNFVAAPLLWIFPPSFPLHAFVDTVMAGAVLYAAYSSSKAISTEGRLHWIMPTLFASGLSWIFAEIVFGQSAYSTVMFSMLFVGGWSANFLAEKENNPSLSIKSVLRDRRLMGMGFLVIIGIVSGVRGVANYVVPLFIAIAGTYFFTRIEEKALRERLKILLGVLITGAIIGFFAYLFLLNHIALNNAAIAEPFSTSAKIVENIQTFIYYWFQLFNALPPAGEAFRFSTAALQATRFFLALFIFWLPLVLLFRIALIQSVTLRFLVFFHLGNLAVISYMVIFTGLSLSVSRYLIPLIPTSMMVVVGWLSSLNTEWRQPLIRMGLVGIVVLLLQAPSYMMAPAFAHWPTLSSGLRPASRDRVIAEIEKAGLTHGFAEFWDATVFTVLSGSKVKIAHIALPGGVPVPYTHVSTDYWYSPEWTQGPTFLLIGPNNANQFKRTEIDLKLGKPINVLKIDGYEVLVYSFNIGNKLWNAK